MLCANKFAPTDHVQSPDTQRFHPSMEKSRRLAWRYRIPLISIRATGTARDFERLDFDAIALRVIPRAGSGRPGMRYIAGPALSLI